MTIKERYEGILEYFKENQPNPETELQHRDPFELLVAVILSAQCTDKRVNMVTPALFAAYPTAQAMLPPVWRTSCSTSKAYPTLTARQHICRPWLRNSSTNLTDKCPTT